MSYKAAILYKNPKAEAIDKNFVQILPLKMNNSHFVHIYYGTKTIDVLIFKKSEIIMNLWL